MNISLLKSYDDTKTLDKSFTTVAEGITAVLKQDTSSINPHFILLYDSGYLSANYIYCSNTDRYYFINDYQMLAGNRIDLDCTVDVLTTVRNSLNALNCNIIRQEKTGLSTLPDSNIMVRNFNAVYHYPFPESFDVSSGSYVLEMIG